MLRKISEFFRLLLSGDPRDKILLKRKLQAVPIAGALIGRLLKLKASLFQRSSLDYVKMQRRNYDLYASADKISPGSIEGDYVVGSWKAHDEWADYNDYLMKYVPRNESWLAIDYGCGPGRNLRRWSSIFARIDGVDISKRNLENARVFLRGAIPPAKNPSLYLTNGMVCGDAPKNYYDFAFSTICLQHICVYDVRLSILRSLFDCLKPGGRISIQMGYGVPSPSTVGYLENFVAATETNRLCDVAIGSPDEVKQDLERIGFESFEYWIRPTGPGDCHPNWIFFTAVKPVTPRAGSAIQT